MSTMPDGWHEWFMTFNISDMTGEVHIYVGGEYVTRESEQPDHAGCWERREGLRLERETVNADGSKSLYFVPLDPDPVPPAPTAGLMVLECPTCDGSGYVEDSESGFRCPDCNGSAGFFVCSACKQIPEVVAGYERCGCNADPKCEICERPAPELDSANVCARCFLTGLEALEREDPDHPALSEAVLFGLEAGWLTPEEAAA